MRETEMEASSSAENSLSRREFAILSMAAVAVGSSTAAAAAQVVVQRPVEIATPDGTCDAVLVSPQASGPWPAAILYPDAMGLRPVKVDMAARLAAEGYSVLVINPFYRVRKAPVFPDTFSFANPDDRAQVMKLIAELDHAVVTRDALALISFLDAQPEVDRKKPIGAVGFCMGGAMTIWAAAARPERVAAAVSFHGGRLVTDDPNSPHRLIARTKAAYHIGIAADDDAKEPDAKLALKQAFDAAGRPATMEVYPGTRHGWTVPDSAAHDPVQAARAWTAMVATFKEALV
jgi:carboxymethylenebutenolidase